MGFMIKAGLLILFSLILSSFTLVQATVNIPYIEGIAESDPLPAGKGSSDDVAIWINSNDLEKSLILGVNKNKKKNGGMGGLYIYDLQGKEVGRFLVGRLNNIDLRKNLLLNGDNKIIDLAIATNRDEYALSIFTIEKKGIVSFVTNIILEELKQEKQEPYGICLLSNKKDNKTLEVFLAQKDGILYQYKLTLKDMSLKLINKINIKSQINAEEDIFIKEIVRKELIFNNELDEELEKLEERFTLEGCVADDKNRTLYVGMENYGIFKIKFSKDLVKYKPELWNKIAQSFVDAPNLIYNSSRLTDDVEGMAIYEDYLFVSAQGINEIAIFDLDDGKYLNSFKMVIGKGKHKDFVTATDGFDLAKGDMGDNYPLGIFVAHDDININDNGEEENGNYKIMSLEKILDIL